MKTGWNFRTFSHIIIDVATYPYINLNLKLKLGGLNMSKILVAYGSKYGATAEIAEKIGEVLRQAGMEVDVASADKAGDPGGYQAVVIGGAIYVGKWRKEASKFLKKNAGVLAGLPVWIFSSGPTGKGDPVEQLKGWTHPKSLQKEIDQIKPRDIKVFGGRYDPEQLSTFYNSMMKKVGAAPGDFRDWDVISAWASGIAAAFTGEM